MKQLRRKNLTEFYRLITSFDRDKRLGNELITMLKVRLCFSTKVSESEVFRFYMDFNCNGLTSDFKSSLTEYRRYER